MALSRAEMTRLLDEAKAAVALAQQAKDAAHANLIAAEADLQAANNLLRSARDFWRRRFGEDPAG